MVTYSQRLCLVGALRGEEEGSPPVFEVRFVHPRCLALDGAGIDVGRRLAAPSSLACACRGVDRVFSTTLQDLLFLDKIYSFWYVTLNLSSLNLS